MAPPKQFVSARLKVQRAHRHINELVSVITTFLQTDFHSVIIEEHPKTGAQVVKIDLRSPYPPEIPLIVGDAIHNLRCALDYIVVEFSGDDGVNLPTGKKRNDVTSKSSSYRTIKETIPDFADFILKEIQPYEGGKFCVWELGQLDNIDKHKLIIPTFNITSISSLIVKNQDGMPVFFGRLDIPHGSISTITGVGALKIENKGEAAVNIKFGPEIPFQDNSVLETLTSLSELTLEAIEAFERFCFGTVTDPNAKI